MSKILIVDDETDFLTALSMRLKANKFEVQTAENGQQALERIEKEIPDLILLDVVMPIMDGYTFYKEIKKNKTTESIPVIVLTARGKMEDTFKAVGVDEFIRKPFENDQLLGRINQLLQNKLEVTEQSKKFFVTGSSRSTVEKMALELKNANYLIDLTIDPLDVIPKLSKFCPDVIVLDVMMEGRPSIDLIRQLRKLPQTAKTPIVVYSYVNSMDSDEEALRKKTMDLDLAKTACLEAGATDSIGKFNESTFLQRILKFIETKNP